MAQYTYNSSNRRLGSFEGLGKSRLGDQALGTFGGFGDVAKDQQYLAQVQADMGAANSMMGPAQMHIPYNGWQYWEFRGKTPMWVTQNAPTYVQRYVNRISSSAKAPAQQQDTGPSAGEVLTGVGTIFGALANPLAQIFATTQQASLERERLKRGGGAPAGDPNAALYAALAARNQGGGGGGSTTIIIAVVLLVVVIGGFLIVNMNK